MKKAAQYPLYFALAIFLIFVLGEIFGIDLSPLGIYPRSAHGFLGIFTAYFIHGSVEHLISNISSWLILATALFWFYPKSAPKVIGYAYLFTGLGVWLFARSAVHIGASGLIYAIAAFLTFSGFFRKDYSATILSLAVILLYSGMLVGIFPQDKHISWESHAVGFIVGIILAFIYRHEKDFEKLAPTQHVKVDLPYQRGYRNWEGKNYRYDYKKTSKH